MNRGGGLAKLALAALAVCVAALVAFALRTEAASSDQLVRVTPTDVSSPRGADRPAALFFGDSYFNGSQYAGRLASIGYLAGTRLGYLTMVGGAGGTGFVHARSETPELPGAGDYIRQMRQGALDTIYRPRLVVIQGGLNDRGEDGVEAAATRVLVTVKRTFPRVPVVLVGPVDLEATDPVAEALERAADAQDVPFVDARDWPLDGVLGPDGIHPTKKGSQILARHLVADLRRAGVKRVGALR